MQLENNLKPLYSTGLLRSF